jgi:MFS family permease
MTHIVIFTTDMGFSDMVGATTMSVMGGFSLAGVLFLGYLSDRMVRKNTLSLTYLIRFISFGIMILFVLVGSNSLWLLYLAMALFGIGWFTTAPLSAGVAADLYGNLRMGTILGLMSSGHMLGMAIGAYAGGAIYDHTKSYLLFFLIQCPIELVAVIAAFSIKQRKLC